MVQAIMALLLSFIFSSQSAFLSIILLNFNFINNLLGIFLLVVPYILKLKISALFISNILEFSLIIKMIYLFSSSSVYIELYLVISILSLIKFSILDI